MPEKLNTKSSEIASLFEFPCVFPIKVMGIKTAPLKNIVHEILSQHIQDPSSIMICERESSGGNYLSITAKFTADSKDQLDKIYLALSSHEAVKVVL